MLATVRELAGDGVDVEVHHRDVSLETPFEGRLVDAMVARAAAPRTPTRGCCPTACPGGTDNKALSLIGIRGYGFAPLQLPADLDFAGHVPRHRRAGAAGRIAFRHTGSAAGSCDC